MERVERVLDAVERVPRGQVASYGDIGRAVGVGARFVGRILARHGAEVAWWRVTTRDGLLPAHLLPDAFAHWADEGVGVRGDGRGCRIADHRVDPTLLIG
ncbi:MAG: MGMT family protein [Nigerium sp.]|nr:MGMT family protein [Nigerium sp.]